MQDEKKSKNQLIEELEELRSRNSELEAAEINCEQAKEDLRKSESLLGKIFESSPDLFSVIDKDYRIIRSNWRGGYESARQKIKDEKPVCYEVYHPGQNEPCIPCHVSEVFRTGKPVIAEKFNPDIGYVEAHTYPLFDDDCNVDLVVVNFKNISERKNMENILRESEAKLKLFFEYTPAAVAMFDRNMKYIHTSRRWLKDYGLGEQDIIGRSHYEVFKEIPDRWKDIHRRCLAGAIETCEEDPFPRPDGKTDWVRWEVRPWRESDGTIGGIIIFSEVITDRKMVEEALRKSNQRLDLLAETASRLLVSDSPQMVVDSLCRKVLAFLDCHAFFNYLVDDDLQRLHLNACGGIPEEDIKKMEWLDYGVGLCGCSARDGCRLVVDNVQDTLDQYTALVRPFGIRAYACHPLIAQGRVLGTLSFCTRNRTQFTDDELSLMKAVADQVAIAMDRKRSEEELRRAHDELEKRVAERTDQLAKTIDTLLEEIVERQETEEALRISKERYDLAVEGANDAIWDTNLLTGESYYSSRYKSILGYEDNELASNHKEWQSKIHPDDLQRVLEAYHDHLAGRMPVYEVECRLRHKDGGYRWILARGACLRDAKGEPYRMAGSLTDITDRKKLEQQLLQSRKMESIGMLAGGVAHEFNNLLTAISGYGQIIQDSVSPNDELLSDSIGQLLKAANRAAELTGSLLAFSRKQVIKLKPLRVDLIIRDACKLIQRIIGEDIELTAGFPDRKLQIMGDAGQMEHVLMNLATNARDAMPSGGHLRISAREFIVREGSEADYDLTIPGKYAQISVSDTGAGIGKETLERIFEPFFTTKETGKGTGLGLSILYGIVKQHNGSVQVKSEPGIGTTFTIYLPAVEETQVSEEKPHRTEAAVEGTETLLVAEDEEMVGNFMAKILEREGYTVIVAVDGEDALLRFMENKDSISLVLTDVVMPKKNGKEIFEEIKKIKPEVKVIFISGYTKEIIHQKGVAEEGVDFITKPFLKGDLLRKVREVLDKDK